MSDIVQKAIELLEDWDTCYSYNEEIRDTAIAALKSQSAEIEKLHRDVKTAVMGDSADLQDVKRENEKLQKQSADSYNAAIDAAALIAKTWGPPNWSWSESSIIIKDTCDEIALAIRGLKNVQRETKTESPVSPEMLYLGPIDTK